MRSKSENITFTSCNDANENVKELFDSLKSTYQNNLQTPMERNGFIFDSVQLMYYKCHKKNFRRGGSSIDSPDQMKKKKATINTKNEDEECFQYAATVALHYGEIESHPERVSNIELFIKKCNWKGINYQLKNR